MYWVYKLDINNYYYIGSTDKKDKRHQHHKLSCFDVNGNNYNTKLYRTIRSITQNFYQDVSFSIIKCFNIEIDARKYEDSLINLEDSYCMNTNRVFVDIELARKKKQEYRKKKMICSLCKCSVYLTHKSRHERSKKHQKFLKKK